MLNPHLMDCRDPECVGCRPADGETEVDRLKRWHIDASMSRDAYKTENEKLHRKVKRMFDWACKASAALDNQDHEHAVDCIERAKLAANS